MINVPPLKGTPACELNGWHFTEHTNHSTESELNPLWAAEAAVRLHQTRSFTVTPSPPTPCFSLPFNFGHLICVLACGFSAWRADPIDPDVDFYELFHAPYTPVPDPSPMMPPVGVQASVLSHDTIKVTWADNSLPKNQKITDNRFYTVRWKTNIPANTKVKVRDSRLILTTWLYVFVFQFRTYISWKILDSKGLVLKSSLLL